jgi:2,3-dihydroxybenzoate-AMP ligase/mycobactin salicyl-AMP ligase
MFQLLEGVPPYRDEDVQIYTQRGWWRGLTLGELLDLAADMHPDKEAFVDRTSRLTYGQAREKAERLALGLIDLGIQPLDRVLIQLPNWNEFVWVYFACQKIGAITVLLIDRYREYEIGHLQKLTGATAWILPKQYKKIDYGPIIEAVVDQHPQLKHVLTVRGEVASPKCLPLEKVIAAPGGRLDGEDKERLAARQPDPLQVAHMGPTGGTTGIPKIVPRIHNSLACGVQHCSMSWDQHCDDITLVAGPIGHDLSFTKAFIGSVITQGKLILLDQTDNQTICETIERERVSAIVWVPALAKRMLEYEELPKYDLSCLKKMHSAGAASHPDLVQGVLEKLKMRFYNGYGGTEGMTCITRATDDVETICCTVGRPTFPHDIYKVVDPFGEELPIGQSGELMVKGPCVFSGYYNNPEENAQVFDSQGFFRTGDVARIDAKGYITLTGRTKEMINRGGESISATEIERLVNRHPQVASVAVIGMPDPKLGERACAYIQTRGGAALSFDEVIAFLKSQQASVLLLPERIEFIDAMPHTAAQKLDKKQLLADIQKKLEQERG